MSGARLAPLPMLRDLSTIRLNDLEFLDASYTGLETLDELTEASLVTLKVAGTAITDLSPIRKMPKLRTFDCSDCAITDFKPLTAVQIKNLNADIREARDAAILKRITSLRYINEMPVNQFWKRWKPRNSK